VNRRITRPELPSSAMPSADEDPSTEFELSAIREAVDSGFTYMLGDGDVRARKDSWFIKKIVINYLYAFLRRNCRRGAAVLKAPPYEHHRSWDDIHGLVCSLILY